MRADSNLCYGTRKCTLRSIRTRPSKVSVQSICRRISEQTAARYEVMGPGDMMQRLNWVISGWANYYLLGQVSPAYATINNHATRRLRQWLCRKHNVKSRKYVRYSNPRLWNHHGLICLVSIATENFSFVATENFSLRPCGRNSRRGVGSLPETSRSLASTSPTSTTPSRRRTPGNTTAGQQ